MGVQLFHASCRVLSEGDVVTATTRTLSRGKARVEEALAKHAPVDAHDRRAAVYAADCTAFALKYLVLERPDDCDPRVYHVRMTNPTSHPMALVDLAGSIEGCVKALADEYWTPTRTWRCLEYLDSELVVEGTVDPQPSSMELLGAGYRYSEDRDDGKRFCQEETISEGIE